MLGLVLTESLDPTNIDWEFHYSNPQSRILAPEALNVKSKTLNS